MQININKKARDRRKARIRAKIHGTKDRPRLNVYRSNKHIFVQIIDDVSGNTLCSYSSKNKKNTGTKEEVAYKIGKQIAKDVIKKGIKEVIFDRNGYKYHGRVRKVAEGAREGGLLF